ncbi:unnamed protein product [Protopolystoma xenopodis]|uniref:Uncharacterized protein n=1 Tax=Protopolystoma xenopodis TaxID=117903 RepID=A0A448WQQ4_9PLAT|nr:unnamed protein product [Protopolystoma xenopodis]
MPLHPLVQIGRKVSLGRLCRGAEGGAHFGGRDTLFGRLRPRADGLKGPNAFRFPSLCTVQHPGGPGSEASTANGWGCILPDGGTRLKRPTSKSSHRS